MAYACTKKGDHKVINIEALNINDESDTMLISLGYKWRSTCSVCGDSIMAKNKSEYEI